MPTEHQGLPVHGYRTQPATNVDLVNQNKIAEERILRLIDQTIRDTDADTHWLEVGRLHIQQGFMAINRAIFQPGRVALPEDDASAEDLRLLGDSD